MQRVRGGGNAVRAIACLPALTGAWRDRAGGVLLSSSGMFPVDKAALQRPDLLAGRSPRTINMSTIGDDLLRPGSAQFGPKIEALIVYNSNPVAVAPESSKVVAGFAREDLFTVVLEHFQTDTADYADYILPATTQLEHWDVHLSLRPHRRGLEPPGDRAAGRGAAQYPDLPRAGAAHGIHRALLCRRRRRACAAAPTATRSISICCWRRASPRSRFPMRRLPTADFPRPRASANSSANASPGRARTACPIICPTTRWRRRRAASRWR